MLVEQGFSGHTMSMQLGLEMKTVKNVTKHKETGSVEDKSRNIWSKKTTIRLDHTSVQPRLANRYHTSPDGTKCYAGKTPGSCVSSSTIRSRLIAAGLRGCSAARQPVSGNVTWRSTEWSDPEYDPCLSLSSLPDHFLFCLQLMKFPDAALLVHTNLSRLTYIACSLHANATPVPRIY